MPFSGVPYTVDIKGVLKLAARFFEYRKVRGIRHEQVK